MWCFYYFLQHFYLENPAFVFRALCYDIQTQFRKFQLSSLKRRLHFHTFVEWIVRTATGNTIKRKTMGLDWCISLIIWCWESLERETVINECQSHLQWWNIWRRLPSFQRQRPRRLSQAKVCSPKQCVLASPLSLWRQIWHKN